MALVLALAAAAAAPARAAGSKAGIAALALWSDPVFRREAEGAAAVLAKRFGHGGPVIVRWNTGKAMVNDPAGIAKALADAGRGLDPARDVLIVLFTSHGAPDGIGDKGGGREGLLPPDEIGRLLAASPVRHKVLIVSACFAGIDADLAGPDTLVVTAADATHTSFGCQPEATWTYFGDAFFNQALRRGAPLQDAFVQARAIIKAREDREGFTPSNPQIKGGEDVLPLLDAGR